MMKNWPCSLFISLSFYQTFQPRFQGENFDKNKIFYSRLVKLAEKHGCADVHLHNLLLHGFFIKEMMWYPSLVSDFPFFSRPASNKIIFHSVLLKDWKFVTSFLLEESCTSSPWHFKSHKHPFPPRSQKSHLLPFCLPVRLCLIWTYIWTPSLHHVLEFRSVNVSRPNFCGWSIYQWI